MEHDETTGSNKREPILKILSHRFVTVVPINKEKIDWLLPRRNNVVTILWNECPLGKTLPYPTISERMGYPLCAQLLSSLKISHRINNEWVYRKKVCVRLYDIEKKEGGTTVGSTDFNNRLWRSATVTLKDKHFRVINECWRIEE